ncbi:MAG: M48 family metallopeptidase [Waddliaceae bacterium]
MFSDVLYLFVVLLLISFSPMGNEQALMGSHSATFWMGMGIYLALLALIYGQNKLFKNLLPYHKNRILSLVNVYLILFLAFDHFVLAPHRLLSPSLTLAAAFSLFLYFLGLFLFHISSYPYLSMKAKGNMRSSISYAWMQLSLTLPFTFPFLLFSSLLDIGDLVIDGKWKTMLLYQSNQLGEALIAFAFTGAFLVAMVLFFPPLLQKFWACKGIQNPAILQRLETLCRRARFKHAGMKTWTVMNHAYTAAIVGVLPRFRYVIFSQKILDALPPESLEAILAHEIGHNDRKHLLIYPFILLGMMAGTALFSLFFSESIDTYFSLRAALTPSPLWNIVYSLAVFLPYLAMIFLYLRFVFGFFSRLFEREADLHVFHLGIPATTMQEALDALGRLTGNTHDLPNWHHGSIQERIDFLEKAKHQPSLIARHHQKVIGSLLIYGFLLLAMSGIVISPLLSPLPPFHQIAAFCKEKSQHISSWLNVTRRYP